MADELEVLEKQQLSAQRSLNDLTDQLTLADHLVYKKYLTELQNYGMVELSQQMLDVQDPAQCIQLFQLQKLTLKKGEDMFQKLSTVYYSSMAQEVEPTSILAFGKILLRKVWKIENWIFQERHCKRFCSPTFPVQK